MNLTPTNDPEIEWARCAASPLYFILNYCQIYDPEAKAWIAFDLWAEQIEVLFAFHECRNVVALKPRQVGLTWLALAYFLWVMIFQPIASILVFSKDERAAVEALSAERLRGMYYLLPDFFRTEVAIEIDNVLTLKFSNGSIIRAFSKSGGDSYTATHALIDEADIVPDLNGMLSAVKPTVDAGGKLFLISRSDKKKPQSEFKRIFRDALEGKNSYKPIFLPWWVRPGRTQAWYEQQKAELSIDDLQERYPASVEEALKPRSTDKRLNGDHINACFQREKGKEGALGIPQLVIYREPEPGKHYDIGLDPAEGNPNSDDSALTVICRETWEEVAMLKGKFEPKVFAALADKIGQHYNNAGVMIERNNHGHAVLLWFDDHSKLEVLNGHDDREGWLSNSKGKSLLYDHVADVFQDNETLFHSFTTWTQLVSIVGSSLRAPEGELDDLADSYALALQGVIAKHKARKKIGKVSVVGLYSS